MRQWGWPVVVAIVLLAAVPFTGWQPAAVSVGLLILALGSARRAPWLRLSLAIAAGLIGAASALQALARQDPSGERAWLGVVALVCALAASVSLVWIDARRRLARAAALGAALLGSVAITLFDINTFYVLAVPLWLIGVAVPSQDLHRQPGH